MRRRLTFEEAANLHNYVQAPARLPNHADVNGNPVYKQFLRLTQIYEEDEVRKRQDDLRDLWVKTHDDRLGPSLRSRDPRRGPSKTLKTSQRLRNPVEGRAGWPGRASFRAAGSWGQQAKQINRRSYR